MVEQVRSFQIVQVVEATALRVFPEPNTAVFESLKPSSVISPELDDLAGGILKRLALPIRPFNGETITDLAAKEKKSRKGLRRLGGRRPRCPKCYRKHGFSQSPCTDRMAGLNKPSGILKLSV